MTVPADVETITAGDLCKVITQHARVAERSIQVEIGPSEVGNDCERRVALALLGSRRPNISRDEWTATVGTACHTWVEKAFRWHNDQLLAAGKPPRWLVETEVTIRPGLFGHCDLYDMWTNTVIDHKFPGVTAIRKYKRQNYPSQQYEWQAHLYGKGWANAGLPVKNVALVMYPRSGLLRDTWMWQVPYDEAIAEKALKRVDDLLVSMNIAESFDKLEELMLLMRRDTEHCDWCPYFQRTNEDPTNGCKGPFSDPAYEPDKHSMTIPGLL